MKLTHGDMFRLLSNAAGNALIKQDDLRLLLVIERYENEVLKEELKKLRAK